jgi:hypothetical protein
MIDTRSYMVAAYTVATLIYITYFASLWVRSRRVSEKIAALSEETNRSGRSSA